MRGEQSWGMHVKWGDGGCDLLTFKVFEEQSRPGPVELRDGVPLVDVDGADHLALLHHASVHERPQRLVGAQQRT